MHTIHRLSFEEAVDFVAEHARKSAPTMAAARVVTIDGRAGAGKSTLAEHLALRLDGAPVVHMDHLYRGWDDALTARLTATLKDQILTPIRMGKSASYRAWDWIRQIEGEINSIPRHDFLILEGVGASQRVVRPFATTMVWVEIEPALGLERVLRRDSAIVVDDVDFLQRMSRWQGQELLHFERENTFDTAHLRFDGGLFR